MTEEEEESDVGVGAFDGGLDAEVGLATAPFLPTPVPLGRAEETLLRSFGEPAEAVETGDAAIVNPPAMNYHDDRGLQ